LTLSVNISTASTMVQMRPIPHVKPTHEQLCDADSDVTDVEAANAADADQAKQLQKTRNGLRLV
jgi:hypothetical protein